MTQQSIHKNPETGTAYVMWVSNRGTSFLASSVNTSIRSKNCTFTCNLYPSEYTKA